MTGIIYHASSILLVLAVCISFCGAATVQFYLERDFKGAVYEANSSRNCTNLPKAFVNVKGSVRTTGCIVVFLLPNCDKTSKGNLAFLVKSEEKRLSQLPWKYCDVKVPSYKVSSFRDCTYMERRPQVDFDLFAEDYFNGPLEEFRDICSCTNLRYDQTTWNYRSAKSYGDCFKKFQTPNCDGVPSQIYHNANYFHVATVYLSIEPCHPSQVKCDVRFNSSIYGIHTKSEMSEPATPLMDVTIAEKQIFVNNGSSTIERYFEARKEIAQALQFQLTDATFPLNDMTIVDGVSLRLGPTFSYLQNQSDSIFQALKSNRTVVGKRELNVREKLTLAPCTKLEVTWLVDIAEIENDLDVHLRVGATIQASKRMEAKFIPHYFESLIFSRKYDAFTAVTKTSAKMRVRFVTGTKIAVNTAPILKCQKRHMNLLAQITYIMPITDISNVTHELQRCPMTSTQTFINNGTTQQEKNYGAEMMVTEIGRFHFANELKQMSSVGFHEDLEIKEVTFIPFLTDVWTKLKGGEMTKEQNATITDTPLKYIVRSNKTCRVEENIKIAPCTEYEVESFVKVAINVEIDYKIQLQVTGQLGPESVDTEEIRNNLEGLTFVRYEDNVTVVVETTGKLMLNYVVGTGVNVKEKPIPECFKGHDAIVANFICNV